MPHGRDIAADPERELLDMYSVEGQRLANVFYSAIAELQEYAFEDSGMANSRASLEMTTYRIAELRDFAGNLYTLVELSPFGYMIYHNDSGVIVERSPTAFSPFMGLYGDLYYSGFGQYFARTEDGDLLHISSGDIIYAYVVEAYNWASHSSEIAENFIAHADVQVLDYLESGVVGIQPFWLIPSWTNITDWQFVRNQTTVTNSAGYCAFVAAAILLGYFDHVRANRNIGIVAPAHVTNRHNTTNARVQQALVTQLRNIGQSLGYGNLTINMAQARSVVRTYLQNRGVYNNIDTNLLTNAWQVTDGVIMNYIRSNRAVMLLGTGLPGPNGPIGGHFVVGLWF